MFDRIQHAAGAQSLSGKWSAAREEFSSLGWVGLDDCINDLDSQEGPK